MQGAGEIVRQRHLAEHFEHDKAARPQHPRHQREHADRRHFHDDDGQLHHDLCSAVHDARNRSTRLSRHQGSHADHDREKDDGEHIALGHGIDRIGRNDRQQRTDDLLSHAAGRRIGGEPLTRLVHVGG